MTNSTRKLLIILGIVLIIGAVRLISSSSGDDEVATPEEVGLSFAMIETERALLSVQKITELKLDASLFSDGRFITLEDFRVDIADVRTGRMNPFTSVQE